MSQQKKNIKKKSGQLSLFDSASQKPQPVIISLPERLKQEKNKILLRIAREGKSF